MKRLVFFMMSFLVLFHSLNAAERWIKKPSYLAWDYRINNKTVGTYLGVLQASQPTKYTCGATTLSMFLNWECQKKGDNERYYNIMQMHKIMNKSGASTSGLTTNELKKGIPIIVDYVRNVDNVKINVTMKERKNKDIKSAIRFLS